MVKSFHFPECIVKMYSHEDLWKITPNVQIGYNICVFIKHKCITYNNY